VLAGVAPVQWGAHDSRDSSARDSSEESTNSDDGYSSNEWSASECNMFARTGRKREWEGGRGRERFRRCATTARKKMDTTESHRGEGDAYVCVCVRAPMYIYDALIDAKHTHTQATREHHPHRIHPGVSPSPNVSSPQRAPPRATHRLPPPPSCLAAAGVARVLSR